MARQGLIKHKEVARIYERESQKYSAFAARMSDLCRYIWAGSLATFFSLLLAAEKTRAFEFYAANKSLLLVIVILSSAALLLDYVQSIAGFRTAGSVANWVEGGPPYRQADYQALADSGWFRLNVWCFVLKNICAIAAAILLGIAVWTFVKG
jgi:hypothetical protein